MDLSELRLRASPWIALILGVGWIVVALLGKQLPVYPGICLLGAAFLLFTAIRWLDRPYHYDRSDLDRNREREAERDN